MKHIKTKYILTFFLVLMVASVLSTVLSSVLGRVVPGVNLEGMVVMGFAFRQLMTLIFCVSIAFGLFVAISKRAVSPIVELTEATREVAKGNFDVQVNERARNDEIGELKVNFNLMVRELCANRLLEKDFITSISHEFKTPIASIQGYAQLLNKDGLDDAKRKEYSSVILEESERLLNLSANILKLSKLENQEIQEEVEEFSLDEQIRSVILLLEPQWSKKGIEMEPALDEVRIYGNEDIYCQVWLNLIGNAIKYTPESGKVVVSLVEEENMAVVRIADNGIGMDACTIERIFDQFYQGETSRKSEGSGLGLAIVKRIVTIAKGSVEVESEEGRGSVFTVRLPINATLFSGGKKAPH